jgi:hypothetical protein
MLAARIEQKNWPYPLDSRAPHISVEAAVMAVERRRRVTAVGLGQPLCGELYAAKTALGAACAVAHHSFRGIHAAMLKHSWGA